MANEEANRRRNRHLRVPVFPDEAARIDGTQDDLRRIARSVLSYAPANFSG